MTYIREAHKVDDFEIVESLIERTIRENCKVDHCDDEHTIRAWLMKAMDDFTDADYVIVFNPIMGDKSITTRISGVAAIQSNNITLNYVDINVMGLGISSLMLSHLEDILTKRDIDTVELISTASARRFYMKHGYKEKGKVTRGSGLSWNFHMYKHLRDHPRCLVHGTDVRACPCRDYDYP